MLIPGDYSLCVCQSPFNTCYSTASTNHPLKVASIAGLRCTFFSLTLRKLRLPLTPCSVDLELTAIRCCTFLFRTDCVFTKCREAPYDMKLGGQQVPKSSLLWVNIHGVHNCRLNYTNVSGFGIEARARSGFCFTCNKML
jgi:hypothetical protein